MKTHGSWSGVCGDHRPGRGCVCILTGQGGGVYVDPRAGEGCLCVNTGRGAVSQRYAFKN